MNQAPRYFIHREPMPIAGTLMVWIITGTECRCETYTASLNNWEETWLGQETIVNIEKGTKKGSLIESKIHPYLYHSAEALKALCN